MTLRISIECSELLWFFIYHLFSYLQLSFFRWDFGAFSLIIWILNLKLCLFSGRWFPEKSFFKLSCICLLLEKLINGKHFPVKEKFGLVSRKVFSFYFERKTLSGSYENFKNIIGPQTFDCYIYFVLNIYFSISSLRI